MSSTLIEAIADRPAPYQARNVFGHISVFFNWAIDRGRYGLETLALRPPEAGPHHRREEAPPARAYRRRDAAFWRATERLGYPYGPLLRLLLVTGQRKSEVAEARWAEFDLANRLWTSHPKGSSPTPCTWCRCLTRRWRSSTACPASAGSLRETACSRPPSGSSRSMVSARPRRRLDREMLAILREADPKAVLPDFVLHDLRRTVRTRLSALQGADRGRRDGDRPRQEGPRPRLRPARVSRRDAGGIGAMGGAVALDRQPAASQPFAAPAG